MSARERILDLKRRIATAVIGQHEVIDQLLIKHLVATTRRLGEFQNTKLVDQGRPVKVREKPVEKSDNSLKAESAGMDDFLLPVHGIPEGRLPAAGADCGACLLRAPGIIRDTTVEERTVAS